MYRIGLTGGIAAGKSTVSEQLAELGAVVIDHDVLAREAVAIGTPGLSEIVRTFGADVLLPDGSLNRPLLGQRVFPDRAALERLNAIVHPEVHRLSASAEDTARRTDPRAIIVHDIPLLVETGQQENFDLLVVVDAPAETRIERLISQRGLEPDDARSRVHSQISDTERLAPADIILDGGGSVSFLRHQVVELWQQILRRAGQGDAARANPSESS